MQDIIAAIASPPGVGAVSLIRVSGKGAWEAISRRVKLRRGSVPKPRRACLGEIHDSSGQAIDEVLITSFVGPASYTGEDTVEIAGHGGVLVTQRVLEAVLSCGVRAAREGEFSERAFLNGKLDLTQAEAVMDLISAGSDIAILAAREQLSGGMSRATDSLRAGLIGVLGELEAYIDFPEEDISPETGDAFLARMQAVRDEMQSLIETEERGRMLREGVRVVIAGRPNAGKSLFLNRLLGYDRAIVSDIAGTTRDTVEETIHLGGVSVRLIDTAGIRVSDDAIEKQGVERSRKQIASADIVLEVVDGTLPRAASEPMAKQGTRRLRVVNKCDLERHDDFADLREGELLCSCLTGKGIDAVVEEIAAQVQPAFQAGAASLVAINSRHRDCLVRALDALDDGMLGFRDGLEPEFVALDLRAAVEAIGEVTGKVDTEEILGEIFGRFCIGK